MASYLPLFALCALLAAFIARSKERNPIAWLCIGLFTGPLGVVIILFLREA